MAINPVLVILRFRVKEIKWETAEVYTLVLASEDLSDMFAFKAGQWAYLHLYDADHKTPWAKAAYSIGSAPSESQMQLEMCIKLKGEFTKRVSKLMPDDVVGVQGPFGVFVLPLGENPLVMFAGGIGITPLRSMIRELVKCKAQSVNRNVTLFYFNKYVEASPYLEEFMDLTESAPWFRFVPVLTQQVPTDWAGERGRIDVEMIRRYSAIDKEATYLMCGPRPFMEAIRAILKAEGIDAKKQLKEELFG